MIAEEMDGKRVCRMRCRVCEAASDAVVFHAICARGSTIIACMASKFGRKRRLVVVLGTIKTVTKAATMQPSNRRVGAAILNVGRFLLLMICRLSTTRNSEEATDIATTWPSSMYCQARPCSSGRRDAKEQ